MAAAPGYTHFEPTVLKHPLPATRYPLLATESYTSTAACLVEARA
jgi:hypothetical protein